MTLIYVIGLPLLALILVIRVQRRSKEQGRALHKMKGHYVFGLFYSAYHPDVWWWESTVALRKIVISFIGVFGGSMGQMQVHLTACLMVVIMLLTAIVRPFGDHLLLHCLDLFALAAVWLTLWAGSVFNDHPRCEDGEGGTLVWCDVLSVVVSVLLVSCLVLVVAVIVYYKKKARAAAALLQLQLGPEAPATDTDDAIGALTIEMTEQDMMSFDFDVNTMESNPMQKMVEEEEEEEEEAADESSSSGGGGAAAVASQQGTINPLIEENVLEILQDAAGRRYSHNKSTGETKWMDDDD
jgi:hypothetical protein